MSRSEATGDNDVVCLLDPEGAREYPVARLRRPMTAREVEAVLAEARS